MRVAFSAGEASGDAYAGAILRELRRVSSTPIEAYGIGGRRLEFEGATLIADSSRWGAMGIAESLRVYPRVARGGYAMKSWLRRGKPGLFVPIDFGFVNLRLARHAKNQGWNVLYFSPPGAWRRDRQGKDLPKFSDAIVTPFPWSAEILGRMGAKALWYGHPIKQLIRDSGAAAADSPRDRIAVLPGSRDSEVSRNLPAIAGALRPESLIAEFAVSPNLDDAELRSGWELLCPSRKADVFTSGDTYGVLRRARAGIVCSGTATIEAALCRCPHVVVYRVSKLTELQARVAGLDLEYISQPNILLRRRAVPELLQDSANPDTIRERLGPLIDDSEERRAQLAAFDELDAMLGPDDAITKTAELAEGMMAEMSR